MKLPKPSSHHLDNHFLLFAFYLDLIIFHLRRDGNHKLHCVPYAFAEIKHAARIAESANEGKCWRSLTLDTTCREYVMHRCDRNTELNPVFKELLLICNFPMSSH